MNLNESVILMSAVRYMLPRNSYGVGCVCDYIKEHHQELSDSNKQVIVRDIEKHFKENKEAPNKGEWLEVVWLLKIKK